ncbi:MAG: HAD family hydrolase [Promicromonosporaceae bacterium]|nr:HAD family hydrolase [Promicromonosporaceae bacterium]
MIKAIVFDVGETLIDESRLALRWARRLGVTPLTLLGLIGAAAARGQGIEAALGLARPGLDVAAEQRRWASDEPDSLRSGFDADDLYPDVRAALAALQAAGLQVIISGNQPPEATPALAAMGLPADVICNSADLGFEKPDPRFFAAVIELAQGLPGQPAPSEIAYVGDRFDNDVLPVLAAGLKAIFLRRGIWGALGANQAASAGVAVVESLLELPALLAP